MSSSESEERSGDSDSSSSSEEYESCQKISTPRSKRCIASSSSSSEVVSVDETESEDEQPVVRRSIGHLVDPDTESEPDEEEKLRKIAYETAESDGEDDRIEAQAYSKTTRRSIFGYHSESFVDDSDVSDSDSDLIDCTAEGNEEDVVPSSDVEDEVAASIKKEAPVDIKNDPDAVKEEESPVNIKSDPDGVKKEESASISTSAAFDIKFEHPQLLSSINNSFEASITSKMSSTIDETTSMNSDSIKVSRSQYEQAVAEKEKIASEMKALSTALKFAKELPDKGEKIKHKYELLKIALDEQEKLLNTLEVDESMNLKNVIARSFKSEHGDNSNPIASNEQSSMDFMKIDDVVAVVTGAKALKNFTDAKALTVEKLHEMKAELDDRPADTELIVPPKHLKIQLKQHQLHGVKFMQWREQKRNPRGGILADDMGLGKTLTTLSLVLKAIQQREDDGNDSDSSDDERDDDGWIARGRKDLKDGGTLVVCPASLLHQWGHEIDTRIKRGAMTYLAFHGAKRESSARKMSKYDVVVTTYGLVSSEMKNNGLLFQLKWNRIVLDEAHVIRNHKSQQSQAVCKLHGKYRWVLTGTPIHNAEFDLYACIKFLHCEPFDDVTYWKRFVEVKKSSSPRVQALLNAIMIRRTKDELMASGRIDDLPSKSTRQVNVVLNATERKIYNRFFFYSKKIFAAFVEQKELKENNLFQYDHKYLDRAYRKLAQKHGIDHTVKMSEVFTLILRLRQICCHTGLIKTALEHLPELENSGENDGEMDLSDGGILERFEALNIDGGEEEVSFSKVQNMNVRSTKIEKVMEVLNSILMETSDKIIVVSQWTSFLAIVSDMLDEDGMPYCELTGEVPIKNRNDIVTKFNDKNSGIRIMLLSLTAGGVGLNLVGANHLMLMDIHWNPQLEQQAQDRIYRFGQSKDVTIYKFICTDTFEESIMAMQQKKLIIAETSLTGAKNSKQSKLTINDLKTLFNML